jgi:hypothetical protein
MATIFIDMEYFTKLTRGSSYNSLMRNHLTFQKMALNCDQNPLQGLEFEGEVFVSSCNQHMCL